MPAWPPGRLALDDERAEALGSPVHRRREARGARADDHGVVLVERRARREPEAVGDVAQRRPDDRRPVRKPNEGVVRPFDGGLDLALGLGARLVEREPPERDPVAVEEASHRGRRVVPAVTDDHRPRIGRFRRDTLEAADPLARERADLDGHLRHRGGEGVVVGRRDAHHAGGLRGPEPARERRAEGDRHLAEDLPRLALPEDPHHPVDELRHLDPTFENGEQRSLVALVDRVLARGEAQIRCRPRHSAALLGREGREHRDGCDLVGCDHDALATLRDAA